CMNVNSSFWGNSLAAKLPTSEYVPLNPHPSLLIAIFATTAFPSVSSLGSNTTTELVPPAAFVPSNQRAPTSFPDLIEGTSHPACSTNFSPSLANSLHSESSRTPDALPSCFSIDPSIVSSASAPLLHLISTSVVPILLWRVVSALVTFLIDAF